MGILIAGVSPHPPMLIPAVGGREIAKVRRTQKALETLAAAIAAVQPETVLIITPHGPLHREAPVVLAAEHLTGDFSAFGAPEIRLAAENDRELVQALAAAGRRENIDLIQLQAGPRQEEIPLDHGVTVPLYYLQAAGTARRCVALTYALLPDNDLFRLGQALQKAVDAVGRRVAIVASADLSHRLIRGAPAGYDPRGREFDEKVVEYLKNYQVEKLLSMEPALVAAAGECGLRSLIILLGSLAGLPVQPEILSYEGPFGVGYPVALFKLSPAETAGTGGQTETRAAGENIYLQIARRSLESRLKGGAFTLPAELPAALQRPGAAFVTLKKDGALRGCIGTIYPAQNTLAAEIAANAISAGLNDPRFSPVTPDELAVLNYSVDVLTTPEKVDSTAELDPQRYGVIVRSGGRTGLLLPALEGVATVEEQLTIARQKAGIGPDEPAVEILRFQVHRYT